MYSFIEGILGAGQMVFHLLTPFLHRRRARLGASDAELTTVWPGDEFVPRPRSGFTQAITIHAPIETVWPWVVQIGQDKAGFYSYEFLENLVGCNIHNSAQVQPEWQSLARGDLLKLHPAVGMDVTWVEPQHGFVTRTLMSATGTPLKEDEPIPANATRITWGFFVTPVNKDTCRFISRWRIDYPATLANNLLLGRWILLPIASVMNQGMLKGVKIRAEKQTSENISHINRFNQD